MREKIAAVMVAIGIAIAFDACMQAEYAMIWRNTFLMQTGFGTLLAVIGLFVAGMFTRHDEDEAEPESQKKNRP